MTRPRHVPNVAAGELPALTPRQELFVLEYLKDFQAGPAARRAGFSARSSRNTGYELLQLPQVQMALTAAIESRKTRLNVDADRVLEELAAIAFTSIDEVIDFEVDGDPQARPAKDISKTARRAIEGVQVKKKGGTRFRMIRKLDALRMLAQHLGLLLDIQIPIDLAQLTPEQLERIKNGEHPLRVLASSGGR